MASSLHGLIQYPDSDFVFEKKFCINHYRQMAPFLHEQTKSRHNHCTKMAFLLHELIQYAFSEIPFEKKPHDICYGFFSTMNQLNMAIQMVLVIKIFITIVEFSLS